MANRRQELLALTHSLLRANPGIAPKAAVEMAGRVLDELDKVAPAFEFTPVGSVGSNPFPGASDPRD